MTTPNFTPENTPGLPPEALAVLNAALALLRAQGMPSIITDPDGELTALADLVIAFHRPDMTAEDLAAEVRFFTS